MYSSINSPNNLGPGPAFNNMTWSFLLLIFNFKSSLVVKKLDIIRSKYHSIIKKQDEASLVFIEESWQISPHNRFNEKNEMTSIDFIAITQNTTCVYIELML